MKLLVLALSLAMTATASAQFLTQPFLPGQPLPKTVTIVNKATGEKIGTATISGNRAVVRNAKDELMGTIVTENGKRTFYDPNGKIIEPPALAREVQ